MMLTTHVSATSDSRMPVKVKRAWIRALRSGKYRPARGRLEQLTLTGKVKGNCCLGVLCRVTGVPAQRSSYGRLTAFDSQISTLSAWRLKKLGLSYEDENRLIVLNDDRRWSFKKIASWIEKNVGEKPAPKKRRPA